MSRYFAITTGNSKLQVDKNRSCSVAFTVTNNADQGIRTRAKISPLETCDAAWISIEGEKERVYTDKTQQYTVNVSIPDSVAPGSYRFRLDIFSVENPDEIYSEGPVVEISVLDKKEAPPAKPFPWWIIAVVAAVLVMGGGIVWWVTHRTETVPNVIGQTLDEAEKTLAEKSFTAKPQTALTLNPLEFDKVTVQDPVKDTDAPKGSPVTITLGKKGIKIPRIVGNTMEDAIAKMNQAGLSYKILVSKDLKIKITEYKTAVNAAPAPATPAPASPTGLTLVHPFFGNLAKPTVPKVADTDPKVDTVIEPGTPVSIYMENSSRKNSKTLEKSDLNSIGVSTGIFYKMVE